MGSKAAWGSGGWSSCSMLTDALIKLSRRTATLTCEGEGDEGTAEFNVDKIWRRRLGAHFASSDDTG